MKLDIRKIKVGLERTNCYVVTLGDETVVIDPGADASEILLELKRIKNLNLKYILLTHGHFDHVGAVDEIKAEFPEVPVYIHENDVDLFYEIPVQGIFVGRLLSQQKSEVEALAGGEFLPFSDEEIEVLHTPGHTPGGVVYKIGDTYFTGDTLFYHTVGRTDLPLSSEQDMAISLDMLSGLPYDSKVYPGHGKETTIGEELENSPYLNKHLHF